MGLSLLGVPEAKAQSTTLPSVQLITAPMVTPATAWSSSGYGVATTHTNGAAAWASPPPEIVAQARALGAGRLTAPQFTLNTFDYVRNNIATEFRFGLAKGGRGALIDQSGTPFDQAELMVKTIR